MNDVSAWKQAGAVFFWRYSRLGRNRQGWHSTADLSGCASFVDLLSRMISEDAERHRTMLLGRVTSEIWGMPSFGRPQAEWIEKLCVEYVPTATDLTLAVDSSRLTMRLGAGRAAALKAAFIDVGIGDGDFSIPTSDNRTTDALTFWWMPRIQPLDERVS